jgi:flagella basal body P-ring formation protein FlgA
MPLITVFSALWRVHSSPQVAVVRAVGPAPAPRRSRWAALGLAALGLVVQGSVAWAQQPQAAADPARDLGPLTQRWLDEALSREQTSGLPLRMEVSIGALDSRLRLAPCARVEPYLPVGARLWGRTRLGLKCVEGATAWNVFLPVTVKAFGPAWVLNSHVASGAVLAADDAMEAEVDWAAETAPVMANPEMWVGQVAVRQLVAGQPLRQNMVRAPHLFKAGAQVKVVARGPGYAVSSAGQALMAGAAGQIVRIKMDNGKILSGTVSENGTVDVAM